MSGSENMIERVARAVWAARVQRCRDLGAPENTIPWPWEQENETVHENVRVEVRAAIEAMMEPTPDAWLIPDACAVIGDADRAASFAADGRDVVPLYALRSSLKETASE